MTGKEEIEREVRTRLQWAAEQFVASNVPVAQIDRLNEGFGRALLPLISGGVTPSVAQRIRNMFGVYKFTVEEMVK